MWIRWVEVRGLRDLPAHRVELEQGVVRVSGPDPASTALFDALELAFGHLADVPPLTLMGRIGASTEALSADFELPSAVSGIDPEGLRAWLAPEQLSLGVTVCVALDPALFAGLRSAAAGDPRVAPALAAAPTVTFAVGVAVTTDHTALEVSLQRLDVGDEPFVAPTLERPRWQRWLTHALGSRVLRAPGPDPIAALRSASRGRSAFAAYQRWTTALLPTGPRLRFAEDADGAALLLGDELPLRRHGEGAHRRAVLAAAAALSGADVLLVEGQDDLLLPFVDGDDASLEQCVCAAGGPPPEVLAVPGPARGPKTFAFPRSPA